MAYESLSTAHLDYLQRIGISPGVPKASESRTVASPDLRRLFRIRRVGRLDKNLASETQKQYRLPSEDMVIGLYGHKIPLAFFVVTESDGVAIQLGTWLPLKYDDSEARLDAAESIAKSVLNGSYPGLELEEVERAKMKVRRFLMSGMALGYPTVKTPDPVDNSLQVDRLIRAMCGDDMAASLHPWAYLVLAQPVEESGATDIRRSIVDEIRVVTTGAQAEGVYSPLADHYTELLEVALKTMTSGLETGLWRTAVYLLGDTHSYYTLAGAWRGIFSGDESLPEPLRVWDEPQAAELAVNWAMPDEVGLDGPGKYQRPLQFQTLLTSRQLSALVHLPQLETSGFSVETLLNFDAVPPPVKENGQIIDIGEIVHRGRHTGTSYNIHVEDLKRHTFVAGVTGSGKTHTIFCLLKEVTKSDVPFLVIEPAKTEYRSLVNFPELSKKLQIFTPGNELVSPLRLNPFEVLSETPVSVHLDLLRSVFTASFGMWTPLPQILEQCLHQVYKDCGWNITTNKNPRLDSDADRAIAFPTLSDLAAKVDEVTRQLGYEDRIVADMRAALLTRINGLRTGGKGRMLDVRRSLPIELLLKEATVLELEGMGDDDDKAFIMGLLLILLAEYRREKQKSANRKIDGLQHLLIIEEAHRLLTNVAPHAREEEANPRGKAVETFTNLLSEVRAYGQGIIVADQVPVKLAPDVIKNTNLKMAHRIVAPDDRAAMAGAMAMDEKQARGLATLTRGEVVVFGEGDDSPLLVEVPPKMTGLDSPDDKSVNKRMAELNAVAEYRTLLLPFAACAETCVAKEPFCDAARQISEDPVFRRLFARLVLSTIENTAALDRLWPDLETVVQSKLSPIVDKRELLRCLSVRGSEWFARRRGAQAEWSYTEVQRLADNLRQVLLAKITDASSEPVRTEFREYALKLHAREFDPFPACSRICGQQPPVCLYRYAAADLIAKGRYRLAWHEGEAAEASSKDESQRQTWQVAVDAGEEMIEFPETDWPQSEKEAAKGAVRRASLCFAQQMLADDTTKSMSARRSMIVSLLKEARHE